LLIGNEETDFSLLLSAIAEVNTHVTLQIDTVHSVAEAELMFRTHDDVVVAVFRCREGSYFELAKQLTSHLTTYGSALAKIIVLSGEGARIYGITTMYADDNYGNVASSVMESVNAQAPDPKRRGFADYSPTKPS
jgi:Tfp pilus assembly PilM family ATPase